LTDAVLTSRFIVPVAAVADMSIFSLGETNNREFEISNASVPVFQSIPTPASSS
jgi:hypothetical protein